MRTIDKNTLFSYSLVTSYEGWLNAESDYNRFYGNSENPPAWDDYELGKKLEFYSSLFKIKFKSEFEKEDNALALGRTFENLLNECKHVNDFTFMSNKGIEYKVILNEDYRNLIENRENICMRTGKPIEKQIKIEEVLPNGLHFIGYADEVYENNGLLIDIKTTSNFNKANYDKSLQIPLYLYFLPFPVCRGFYQVTEFYKSKAKGVNQYEMRDTFIIEAFRATDSQVNEFANKCAEILKLSDEFKREFNKYKNYFI